MSVFASLVSWPYPKDRSKVKGWCGGAEVRHACSVTLVMCDSLQPHGLEPASLLCPWDSLGKKTGKWKKVKVKSLSCIWLFATLWTVAYQAPQSMEFSRQEFWSGLPFSSPRGSSQSRDRNRVSCIAGRHFTIWATWEAQENRSGLPFPPLGSYYSNE